MVFYSHILAVLTMKKLAEISVNEILLACFLRNSKI